jgi:hypothetical protein
MSAFRAPQRISFQYFALKNIEDVDGCKVP